MVSTAKRRVLLCFGFGFTLRAFIKRLPASFDCVVACRSAESLMDFYPRVRFCPFADVSDTLLAAASHILISVPPQLDVMNHDLVWSLYGERLLRVAGALGWLGYLSSASVYGDHDGAWVDEDAPMRGVSDVAQRRQGAERLWLDFARDKGIQGHSFRLPGIYGQGRCVFDGLLQGRTRQIIKQDHVFSRIHVDDAALAIDQAMNKVTRHTIYNVCDDEPAPSWQVVRYGCALLGIAPPLAETWREGLLPDKRARFYRSCRRLSNRRIKEALGFKPRYPTYKQGLSGLYHGYYKTVAGNPSGNRGKTGLISDGRRP